MSDHPPMAHDDTARRAIGAWTTLVGGDPIVRPMSRRTNPVWSVEPPDMPPLVLKVLPEYPPGVDRVTEHRVVTHLVGYGIRVPLPLVTDAGTISAESTGRQWQLLPRLPGSGSDGWRAMMRQAGSIGAAVGRLQRALAAYRGPVGSYRDEPVAALDQAMADLPGELTDPVTRLASRLRSAVAGLPEQLTHGDLNEGNVLVADDGSVGFLDCDHLPTGPRIRDLAYHLASLVHRRLDQPGAASGLITDLLRALPEHVDGFHAERPITDHERRAVVPLMLVTELAGARWALRGWEPDPAAHRRSVTAARWLSDHHDQLVGSLTPT